MQTNVNKPNKLFKMALSNILLLSQIAGYVIAFILSVCIVVPMSLHQDDFKYEVKNTLNTLQYIIFSGAIVYFFLLENGKKRMDSYWYIGLLSVIAIIQFLLVLCFVWSVVYKYIGNAQNIQILLKGVLLC